MALTFNAVIDNHGRINHFVVSGHGHPDAAFTPELVHTVIDGDERVRLGRVAYTLTSRGSLIHPEVEVPDHVTVGSGVLLEEGTWFISPSIDELDKDDHESDVVIGAHAKIRNAAIHAGVTVGDHAILLATSIGKNVEVGPHTRIGAGTFVHNDAKIAGSVKIDENGHIGEGATIGFGARIGYNSKILKGAEIGADARIGTFLGSNPKLARAGALVGEGRIIPPKGRV